MPTLAEPKPVEPTLAKPLIAECKPVESHKLKNVTNKIILQNRALAHLKKSQSKVMKIVP